MPDIHQALTETGNKRRNAERQLAEATDTLRKLVPQAIAEGISVTDIARLSGVSRQTVYNMARQQDR